VHPFGIIHENLRVQERERVKKRKRGTFVAKGTHSKVGSSMKIEERSKKVHGGHTIRILSRLCNLILAHKLRVYAPQISGRF